MTAQQYFQRYFELLKDYKNGEGAYNALEAEYFKTYKKHRYTTYNSFKRMKNYYFGIY